MKIILNIQWLLGASHSQKTMIPNALYRENLIKIIHKNEIINKTLINLFLGNIICRMLTTINFSHLSDT